MISVEAALAKVKSHALRTPVRTMNVAAALNSYLAQDVISPMAMPPFRQAAMDGYGLNLHDGPQYDLVGEVAAGSQEAPVLSPGQAVRIFTGAPVPDTVNAVIMQEKVSTLNDGIQIEEGISEGKNIRPLGEQIQKGQVALPAGTHMNPAAIGFLQSLGITEIKTYSMPRVAIVTTGSELVKPGNPLAYGQIYESNGVMLKNALHQLGYQQVTLSGVTDDYQATKDALANQLATHDVLLVSGGISVGEYDFVSKALRELQVQTQFYKIKQKPGKPLFFGTTLDTLVFGLPGNPASSLTCFYIYVQPAMERLKGNPEVQANTLRLHTLKEIHTPGPRAQFLKAIRRGNKVEILTGQSSSMIHSFAMADALVFIPAEVDFVAKDEEVMTYLIPH